MSRRRSSDRSIPISIAIPQSVVTRLDQLLAFNESRSAYITKAIKERISGMEASSIADANTRTLMAALTSREDIDTTLRHLLLQILAQ